MSSPIARAAKHYADTNFSPRASIERAMTLDFNIDLRTIGILTGLGPDTILPILAEWKESGKITEKKVHGAIKYMRVK